ncbi:MAG TPA: ATPase [Persephonella sp.]|nr:ATPase [Persephonella sp.]
MSNRKDRLIQEYIHDPYFTKEKYPDPSICERCGVVFHEGVFQWIEPPPKNAEKMICPACRRIEDRYEGGIVVLEGDFLKSHKEEIINLIRNVEQNEMAYRPLERVINMEDEGDKITITTTYEHLARRIGEAVHRAYKGDLNFKYPEGTKYIRVHWKR